jgi:hypothetical protein
MLKRLYSETIVKDALSIPEWTPLALHKNKDTAMVPLNENELVEKVMLHSLEPIHPSLPLFYRYPLIQPPLSYSDDLYWNQMHQLWQEAFDSLILQDHFYIVLPELTVKVKPNDILLSQSTPGFFKVLQSHGIETSVAKEKIQVTTRTPFFQYLREFSDPQVERRRHYFPILWSRQCFLNASQYRPKWTSKLMQKQEEKIHVSTVEGLMDEPLVHEFIQQAKVQKVIHYRPYSMTLFP